MRQVIIALFLLVGLPACEEGAQLPSNKDAEPMTETFFDKYTQSELGSTKYVQPGEAPGFRGPAQKMIDISVEDSGACPVVVSIRSEYTTADDGTPQTGYPLVGILQWGIGGGENQLEFDIPAPRYPANLAPAGMPNFQPMTNAGQGVLVHISGTSHVSLYVRNDSRMSPLNNPGADTIGFIAPAKVIAFVGPSDGGNGTRLERTIFAVGGTVGSVLAPGASVQISVPPFAKSVRFQRNPGTAPIEVDFLPYAGAIMTRIVDLGVNDEGPIPLSATANTLVVYNRSAADILQMQAVFDVTP